MEKHKRNSTCIIVLTHNRLDITTQFLSQLFANTYEKFSLVLVDNGSTDGTKEYLEELSNKKDNVYTVFLDHNSGVINGRNAGYEKSKQLEYDYLSFLDNDQFVDKGWLEDHISFIERGYDVVGVEAWTMSETFRPIRKIDNVNDSFSYVGAGGMLISREVVDQVGLFDVGFNPMYFEDPDFCFKCDKSGFRFGWNPDAKVLHKPHQTMSILSQEDRHKYFRRSLKYFREKWKGHKVLFCLNK